MKGIRLSRRRAGMVLTGAGTLMLLSGVAGWVLSSDGGRDASPEPVANAQGPAEAGTPVSTTPIGAASTTGTAVTTTEAPSAPTDALHPTTESPSGETRPPPATTEPPTPPTTTTLTTAAPTSSTTTPPADRVAAFVDFFASAIAAGDVDALMETLHPSVIEAFGMDLCRSFTEREILELEDYALTGAVTGPVSKSLDGGGDPVLITGIYEAGVRFTFQGQAFDTTSDFVVADTVSWLAICR